ncbi:MAG: hypothetical protein PUD25_01590 [Bacilli bacterium]|nr:hypothetical protein [Bacilli bacterium]
MNQFFILNYIKKLTKNDIVNFVSKQNISLRDDEIDVIYSYIKTRYSDFFAGREKELLLEIKEQVSSSTYLKILEYYQLYLEKVKNKKL